MPENKEWELDEFLGLHSKNKYGDEYYVNLDHELDLDVTTYPSHGEPTTVYVRLDELRRLFGARGYEIRRKVD